MSFSIVMERISYEFTEFVPTEVSDVSSLHSVVYDRLAESINSIFDVAYFIEVR